MARRTEIDERLTELRRRWGGYWPGADLDRVEDDVRTCAAAAAQAWCLTDLSVLPNSAVALVHSALQGDDTGRSTPRPVVLKVNPRGHDHRLATEATVLTHWHAAGLAPAVLATRDENLTLLLERVLPGDHLDDEPNSFDEHLRIIGELARRLHAIPEPPSAAIVEIGEYASDWQVALARDPELAETLSRLVGTTEAATVIHGDLHGANVIRGRHGWVVIDPKAVRGDPHADVWALVDPLAPELPAGDARAASEASRRVNLYSLAAGLDPERAAAWTWVRARATALELDDHSPGTAWARRLHRLSDALRSRPRVE